MYGMCIIFIEMSVCEIRWDDVFDLWIFFFLEKNLNLNKKDVNLKFKKFFFMLN